MPESKRRGLDPAGAAKDAAGHTADAPPPRPLEDNPSAPARPIQDSRRGNRDSDGISALAREH